MKGYRNDAFTIQSSGSGQGGKERRQEKRSPSEGMNGKKGRKKKKKKGGKGDVKIWAARKAARGSGEKNRGVGGGDGVFKREEVAERRISGWRRWSRKKEEEE